MIYVHNLNESEIPEEMAKKIIVNENNKK